MRKILLMVALAGVAVAIGVSAAQSPTDSTKADEGVETPPGVPPAVEDYRLGELDPDEVREAARSGGTVTLAFEDVEFTIKPRLHDMRLEGFKAGVIENGTFSEVDQGPPDTYRADVVETDGVDSAESAALNIRGAGLDGSIRDASGAWFIEPVEGEAAERERSLHVLYRDVDVHGPVADKASTSQIGQSHPR
jgi:hypothetical protein